MPDASAIVSPPGEWLVLFYLAGDLDSPRSLSIREDLCEILAAGKDPDGKVKVVVQFDSLANCFRYVVDSEPSTVDHLMKAMEWPKVRESPDLPEDYEDLPEEERHTLIESLVGQQKAEREQHEEWQGCYHTLKGERRGWEEMVEAELSRQIHRPTEVLGRINSGSADELENFIVWGLSQANGGKVALVVAGKDRLDPVVREGEGRRLPQVFTLCRDDSTRDHLSFVEFSGALRRALRKSGQGRLDILAIDSAQSQFLELAHELEGSVDVLIGAQTPIPESGWNYEKVLAAWRDEVKNGRHKAGTPRATAAAPVDPREPGPLDLHTAAIARRLVAAIQESYQHGKTSGKKAVPEPYAVSAINLNQLAGMTGNFDSGCMTFMQSLGEGVVWDARRVLRRFLDRDMTDNQYDCGIFFRCLALVMKIKWACAVFDWMIWDLKQHGIGQHNRQFWNDILKKTSGPDGLPPAPPVIKADYGPFGPIDRLKGVIGPAPWALNTNARPQPRIKGQPKRKDLIRAKANRLILDFRIYMDQLLRECVEGTVSGSGIGAILEALQAQDRWLMDAVLQGAGFPSEERRKSFEHMLLTRETCHRLAMQADGLLNFFPPAGYEPSETDQPPLVLARACTDEGKAAWWTGLSVYRPGHLDMLMNPEYRDFSFHRKVHWAALLGAIYLIEAKPPLAMWRLISSLITRGSGSTRRDLLDHLSGKKSVIWGMENQFRILAPAPVITLTLERRETIPQRASKFLQPPQGMGGMVSSGGGSSAGSSSEDQVYLVRLESHRQGAIIFEHTSRVRAVTLERVLSNLGEVLDRKEGNEASFSRLSSLGGILGDEVLQDLARALESERLSIRREVRKRNGIRRCDECGRGSGVLIPQEEDDEDVDVHLQLHIPRELMQHPWELMSVQRQMLGFRFAVGRRVFMDTSAFRGDREREQGTVRPLLVVPRYEGGHELAEAKEEMREIQECFKEMAKSRGQVIMFCEEEDTLKGDQATWLNFLLKLQDGRYDIIHFAGHGKFVANDPEASAWVFADGSITAREIRNALRNHPAPPWLVYANACKAGLSARAHSSPYVGEVHGLATAFISNGVAAYVAPLWDVADGIARQIAVDFYKELLLHGATLGEALLRAKRRVKRQYEKDFPEHAGCGECACGASGNGGQKAPQTAAVEAVVLEPVTAEPVTPEPVTAESMAAKERKRRSFYPVSGAGVVLFGDTSGELIQALAGIEKISRSRSGDPDPFNPDPSE